MTMIKLLFNNLFLPINLIKCFLTIILTPKYLITLSVPYILGLISFFITNYYAFSYRQDIIHLMSSTESWYYSTIKYLSYPIILFLSSIISIVVVLLFAETFIEYFLRQACKAYQFPCPDSPFSIKDIFISFKGDILRILFIVGLTLLTFFCSLFPLLLFIPPIVAVFLAGLDLISLPLSIFEIPFKRRLKLAIYHFIETLSLGATLILFLMIPLGGFIFLPAAYLLALKKISTWQEIA